MSPLNLMEHSVSRGFFHKKQKSPRPEGRRLSRWRDQISIISPSIRTSSRPGTLVKTT